MMGARGWRLLQSQVFGDLVSHLVPLMLQLLLDSQFLQAAGWKLLQDFYFAVLRLNCFSFQKLVLRPSDVNS